MSIFRDMRKDGRLEFDSQKVRGNLAKYDFDLGQRNDKKAVKNRKIQ